MTVVSNIRLSSSYSRLELKCPADETLNEVYPGQFVQVEIVGSRSTFLRRPISVCDWDAATKTLTLLVRRAGAGTSALCDSPVGTTLSIIGSLGHGFDIASAGEKPLLIGGGVGCAPLLYLAKELNRQGITPDILVGARSYQDILLRDEFDTLGRLYISTDDGSEGNPGVVTLNPRIQAHSSMIFCCGPMPMMRAVAEVARRHNTQCQVSLENVMACGLGACLCCVEDTADSGNVCVCTEGPVFNIERLKW